MYEEKLENFTLINETNSRSKGWSMTDFESGRIWRTRNLFKITFKRCWTASFMRISNSWIAHIKELTFLMHSMENTSVFVQVGLLVHSFLGNTTHVSSLMQNWRFVELIA